MIIYKDSKTANWKNNPIGYEIKTMEVSGKSILKLNLKNGGRTAGSFGMR
ncbi:MAG: hypothetical protein WAV86_04995 [Lutibacter sp.]